MESADGVTLQEAADLIGVHYMTAYRWVRSGQLAATKDENTWFVTREAVESFRKERAKPRATGNGSTAPKVGRRSANHVERLVTSLRKGDEGAAVKLVETAISNGWTAEEVHLDLLPGAMRRIGDLWSDGELTVSEEHQATSITYRLIGRLAHHFVRRGRPRSAVVIGAPAGDTHGLPVALLASPVRGRGHRVVELGANTPGAAFLDAIAATPHVSAVGIVASAGTVGDLAATISDIRTCHPDLDIVLGGGAIEGEQQALDMGATFFAASASSALHLLTGSEKEIGQ